MSGRQRFAIASLVPVFLLALALYAALMAVGPRAKGSGNYGYQSDPAGARQFAAEAGTFRDVGAEAVAKALHRDVFLYRAVDKVHRKVYGKPWVCLDQGEHGSCVSFAFSLAALTSQSVDHVEGRMREAPPAVATEPIYGGARTVGIGRTMAPGGDGATGFGAARWVSGNCPSRPEIGGLLYRQPYGTVDLSRYSIPLSRAWGRNGVPDDLAKLAHKTRVTACANVQTWDELVAAIERGSAVVLASQVGYGRLDNRMPVRDADGFLERGKAWGHAMCCYAVRHQVNGSPRDGGLIQNSWGPSWCGGPRWPPDQPDGSFWASRENIQAALSQGDCWAVAGSVSGFAWRELDHWSWLGADE